MALSLAVDATFGAAQNRAIWRATPPAAFFLCSRACDEYLSDGGLGGRLCVGNQCGCDARCSAQAERRGEAGVYRGAGERDSAA